MAVSRNWPTNSPDGTLELLSHQAPRDPSTAQPDNRTERPEKIDAPAPCRSVSRRKQALPSSGASDMATGQLNSVIRHLRKAALREEVGAMTDGQLLERFLTHRDEVAFEVLLRRHGPMVLGVCRRVLRNAHDAEDAFQATFLVLVRKAASLRRPELVGNWLYGAACRAALEAKAARRRSRPRQFKATPELEAPADVREDLRAVLDQELSCLPDKYRVPLVLCDLEARTRREVARQLGIPEGTLSSRLTTARRKLAQRLTRRDLALSGGALAAALSGSAAACVPA